MVVRIRLQRLLVTPSIQKSSEGPPSRFGARVKNGENRVIIL